MVLLLSLDENRKHLLLTGFFGVPKIVYFYIQKPYTFDRYVSLFNRFFDRNRLIHIRLFKYGQWTKYIYLFC